MPAFNVKAGLTPITTLLIQSNDLDEIQQELKAKADQAPKMFIRLPCIFDFSELDESIDLAALHTLCHDFGMLPIGVKNSKIEYEDILERLSLADFGKSRSKTTKKSLDTGNVKEEIISEDNVPSNEVDQVELDDKSTDQETITQKDIDQDSTDKAIVAAASVKTTIHKFPVRSGQQLRAEGDLVIFGLVSTGAEVLAGGSIQIFGPLRGRALAGIQGNNEATISCQSLEAELVAIAGEYKLFEDSEQHCKQATVIQLDNGRLNIESL